MPKDKRYSIGIIASPRQPGLTYKTKHGTAEGEGTSITQRGMYQFTGHTAVYMRQDRTVFSRGLVPEHEVLSAVVAGQTVQGTWQDDKALFYDPTSIVLDVDVDEETALAFKQYYHDYVQTALHAYTLRPETYNETNCVHSALIVFINFMSDYSDKIRKTHPEKSKSIDHTVDKLLNLTSEHTMTMQGHLMQTINAINADKKTNHSNERLVSEIKNYLSSEIHRLQRKKPNTKIINKIEIGQKILTALEGKKNLDDQALKELVNNVDSFARINTRRFSQVLGWNALTMRGWQVILKCYHLTSMLQPTQGFRKQLSEVKESDKKPQSYSGMKPY